MLLGSVSSAACDLILRWWNNGGHEDNSNRRKCGIEANHIASGEFANAGRRNAQGGFLRASDRVFVCHVVMCHVRSLFVVRCCVSTYHSVETPEMLHTFFAKIVDCQWWEYVGNLYQC